MDDRGFEQTLRRVLKADFSAGTERFRYALLTRCLDVLDEDDGECAELDDDVLELLSAAGDSSSYVQLLSESKV